MPPCGDCLPWTDRLGTRFLGRCSGSNQVRSVPSSADGGWTIPLQPKKKRGKKRKKSFCLSMSMGSGRGRSGRHCLQSCKLGHGMSLLCKRHTMLRPSDVPALTKCVRLCLLVSLLARSHGPPCSRTTGRHCLARQFSRPKRYASCRGVYSLRGHLYGHTCHSSYFTRVAHMCHDMTGPAIMAGRLGARTFCLPLGGIACHGLIA